VSLQTTVDIRSPLLKLAWFSAVVGGLPLWPYLQRPVQVLLPLALLAGVWAEHRRRVLLGGYWGTLAVVLVFLFYALQVRLSYLVDPVINMLALMLAVRVAGEKSPRNLLQLYLLSIFALAASTLISLEMSFMAYLPLLVLAVTVSLVLLAYYTHDVSLAVTPAQLRCVLSWSLLLPLVSLLLMVFFFFVLPRTESPLLHFLAPGGEGSSGFSESVAPGSVAGNADNPAVAFRAEGPAMDPMDLYWRVIVLNVVEKGVWRRAAMPAEPAPAWKEGRQVTLKILPEDWRRRYLVTLDKPLEVDWRRVRVDSDLVYSFRWAPRHRYEYRVTATMADTIPSAGAEDMSAYLQVPQDLDPRVAALAERVRGEQEGAPERLAALREFFLDQELAYSTQNIPVTESPVADFLFASRVGYCEHFASSFALLARLVGIPARLVGGYYGGVYNEIGGYTLVTESMAHVWVEAFVPGHGWVRIDPSLYAANVATSLQDFSRHRIPSWRGVMDSMEHFWAQAVLNFYLEQQIETLQSARRTVDGMKTQVSWWQLVLGLAGVGVAAILYGLWRRPHLTAEQRLVKLLRERAANCYGEVWGGETLGLQELARGTGDPAIAEFARIYQPCVFRDRSPTAAEAARLRRLLEQVGRVRGAQSDKRDLRR